MRSRPTSVSSAAIEPPGDGERVAHRWHYLKLSTRVLRVQYNAKYPEGHLSLASHYRLLQKLPWAKPAGKAMAQSVCCCEQHTSFRWLLSALTQLTDQSWGREDLVKAAMCNAAALECVENRCPQCMDRCPVAFKHEVMHVCTCARVYVTKKGIERKRRVQVSHTVKGSQLADHVKFVLGEFKGHDRKSQSMPRTTCCQA